MGHEGVNQEKFILHSQHLFEDALCIEMFLTFVQHAQFESSAVWMWTKW